MSHKLRRRNLLSTIVISHLRTVLYSTVLIDDDESTIRAFHGLQRFLPHILDLMYHTAEFGVWYSIQRIDTTLGSAVSDPKNQESLTISIRHSSGNLPKFELAHITAHKYKNNFIIYFSNRSNRQTFQNSVTSRWQYVFDKFYGFSEGYFLSRDF